MATPAFTPYIVPLPPALLPGLYLVQSRGTAGIGEWFGPITLLWFAVLAAMDLVNIAQAPAILAALNPCMPSRSWSGIDGWLSPRWARWGLAFTGAEALYADMVALYETLVIMLMLNECR